jgi:ubiquinone/menaquinone biosynthesis C-methylase UbiE
MPETEPGQQVRPNDWRGGDGAYWAANDLRYDAILAPLTPHLLDAAGPRPGERVLDVGCGCGNTTRLAGRRAADVLGVDLSEDMLARARQRTDAAGLTNVRFARADAQRTAFEPVDVVLSQFGVMFFDDPAAAFANLRRAGRRIAFLCWQAFESNENRALMRETLDPYVDLPAPSRAGALSLAEPARVRDLLETAGFHDVELADVREPLPFGRDAADATEFALAEPAVAEWLAAAGPDAARRAADALRAAYAARETPEGVLLGTAAWLVTAR